MQKILLTICIAWLLTVCSCCASPGKSFLYNARPLHPEGWYARLYDQAKACVIEHGGSLRKGSQYSRIHWYVTTKGAMGDAIGLWSWPDRIFLDEMYAMNWYVVRHELLHDLLGAGLGQDAHDDPIFKACVDAPVTP